MLSLLLLQEVGFRLNTNVEVIHIEWIWIWYNMIILNMNLKPCTFKKSLKLFPVFPCIQFVSVVFSESQI